MTLLGKVNQTSKIGLGMPNASTVVWVQSDKVQTWPCLGCNTGTGKPAVFPKRVRQVRVRCWILTHRRTPRTRAAVLQVLTGLL